MRFWVVADATTSGGNNRVATVLGIFISRLNDNSKNMTVINSILPKYSNNEIESFDNENQYMDAHVELLKQTIELIFKVVELRYCNVNGTPKKINKEEAVIGGNLTRLAKLNISFLQNICEGKLEICYIINRCIAETAVNTKFLLIEGEERAIRNYIKYSLITEKELWETILTNIRERGGEVLPIEERMQKSIQNSFDKSDFDLEEVKRSSKWKSIKERANLVAGEMFYSVFYGIASHSIHGNWQDILFNNLKKVDDGFELNFEWNSPKPQIIEGAILLNLDIIKTFCERELNSNINVNTIIENREILYKYLMDLSHIHEKWILKRSISTPLPPPPQSP
jgi:hypothetical protein